LFIVAARSIDSNVKIQSTAVSGFSVTISQNNLCEDCAVPVIHLAEIRLFNGSDRVNISSIQMSSYLTDVRPYWRGYSGPFCMDDRFGTFCHTGVDDTRPSITISSASVFDRMEVYNRGNKTGHDRIIGAVVTSTDLTVLGTSEFLFAAWNYTFRFGPADSSIRKYKKLNGKMRKLARISEISTMYNINYTYSIFFKTNFINQVATFKNANTNFTSDVWRAVGPKASTLDQTDGGRVR
jgi:hypothetical protein